jgi:hypothetical protein
MMVIQYFVRKGRWLTSSAPSLSVDTYLQLKQQGQEIVGLAISFSWQA